MDPAREHPTQTKGRMTTAELLEQPVMSGSSGRDSNLPLIDFIRAYMDGLAVGYRVNPRRMRAHTTLAIEPDMRAVDADCDEVPPEMPGMALPADRALAAAVKHITGSNGVGQIPPGTEGGVRRNAGSPTIAFGPDHTERAHRPDECVVESEIEACDRRIRRLADRPLV
jgi:acetylornithine deacetylase/succinyl-diaminopimelate desuccinylase-like protein